jgi:hypothetical protein
VHSVEEGQRMPDPKTQKTQASVARFLASIKDEQRRADCRSIQQIMENATAAKAQMWGAGIVGFGEYSQKYANGSERKWMRVAFAPRSDRITLYVSPGFEGYDELMAKLGKYKAGNACIHIKRLAEIDLPTLKKLIKKSVDSLGRN